MSASFHSLSYSAVERSARAWDRSDRARDGSDRAKDGSNRARDRARGIELGIGLRINNARRTVLARVSGLVFSNEPTSGSAAGSLETLAVLHF